MKTRSIILLLICRLFLQTGTGADSTTVTNLPARLVMPDGQLRSHPIRVFVANRRITPAMQPTLYLRTSHSLLKPRPGETNGIAPLDIAVDQQEVEANKQLLQGTLLTFNLQDYPMHWYKAMIRLEPVLEWAEEPGKSVVRAIGRPVYLGNLPTASVVTLVAVGLLVAALARLSQLIKGRALYLLVGPDNTLSLWRSQVAAWTLAVGAMVFLFGIIRCEVPSIPDSLVMLMGMSVLTGGLSHFKGKQNAEAEAGPDKAAAPPAGTPPPAAPALPSPPAPVPARAHVPSLQDLIAAGDGAGGVQVSIARAQLVFWTCLTLGLFVVKTVLEGALWDVPLQLVAFMGISQAGYLGPKFFDSK